MKSQLTGNGYGDKHTWKAGDTVQSPFPHMRGTYWECVECGAAFRHYYHVTPDIHMAIKNADIPEECERNE